MIEKGNICACLHRPYDTLSLKHAAYQRNQRLTMLILIFFFLYSMLSMLFQPFDAYDDHKTIYVLRLNLLFTNSIHQVATRMSCSFSVSFFISSCVSLYLFLCLSLVLCVLTIVGRQSYHKSIFFRQKIPLLALNSNKRSAIDFFSFHGHFFAAPKQSIISLNLTASEKNA